MNNPVFIRESRLDISVNHEPSDSEIKENKPYKGVYSLTIPNIKEKIFIIDYEVDNQEGQDDELFNASAEPFDLSKLNIKLNNKPVRAYIRVIISTHNERTLSGYNWGKVHVFVFEDDSVEVVKSEGYLERCKCFDDECSCHLKYSIGHVSLDQFIELEEDDEEKNRDFDFIGFTNDGVLLMTMNSEVNWIDVEKTKKWKEDKDIRENMMYLGWMPFHRNGLPVFWK